MRDGRISGVLYAEDFDAPAPALAAAPVPPPPAPPPAVAVVEPSFTLDELRAAAERARQDGRALERRAAETEAARQAAEALTRIAQGIEALQREVSHAAEAAAASTADTILAMAGVALPAWCAAHGRAEAQALLQLLLPAMKEEPRLSIRVHPALLDDLRLQTSALLEDADTIVDWLPNESALPGDITVRWQGGMMMRDSATLCQQVNALIMGSAVKPSKLTDFEQEDPHHG